MHKTVPVRVKKPYTQGSHTHEPGEEFVLPTLEALIAARRGLVKVLRHLTVAAGPEPPRKRRAYKRRDLQAETSE